MTTKGGATRVAPRELSEEGVLRARLRAFPPHSVLALLHLPHALHPPRKDLVDLRRETPRHEERGPPYERTDETNPARITRGSSPSSASATKCFSRDAYTPCATPGTSAHSTRCTRRRQATLRSRRGDAVLRRPHPLRRGRPLGLGGTDHRKPHGLRHPCAHEGGNRCVPSARENAPPEVVKACKDTGSVLRRRRRRHRRLLLATHVEESELIAWGTSNRSPAQARSARSPLLRRR